MLIKQSSFLSIEGDDLNLVLARFVQIGLDKRLTGVVSPCAQCIRHPGKALKEVTEMEVKFRGRLVPPYPPNCWPDRGVQVLFPTQFQQLMVYQTPNSL